jgi:hypothetical protein
MLQYLWKTDKLKKSRRYIEINGLFLNTTILYYVSLLENQIAKFTREKML